MLVEALALSLLAGLLTFALHSVLALGLARLALPRLASAWRRELGWRLALVAGLVTALAAVCWRDAPAGSWFLARRAPVELSSERAAPPAALLVDGRTGADRPWLDELRRLGAPEPWQLDPRLKRRRFDWSGDRSGRELPDGELVPFSPFVGLARAIGAGEPAEALGTGSTRASGALARLAPWLCGLWLAGALLGLARLGSRYRALARLLADRRPILAGPAHERLAWLARKLGLARPPRLYASAALPAPLSRGLLRAEICLPERALVELAPEELEALLAHELAHLLRRDPAWLFVFGLAEALLFFQPLVRSARLAWQEEVEPVCDDAATRWTGNRVALATCLAEVAEWVVHERRLLPAPAMAASGERLLTRVRRLLEPAPAPTPRRGGRLAAVTVALSAGLMLFAPRIRAEVERAPAPETDAAELAPSAPISAPDPAPSPEPILPPEQAAAPESAPRDPLDTLFDPLRSALEGLALELLELKREAPPERADLGLRLARARAHLGSLRERCERLAELSAAFSAAPTEPDPSDEPSTTR